MHTLYDFAYLLCFQVWSDGPLSLDRTFAYERAAFHHGTPKGRPWNVGPAAHRSLLVRMEAIYHR
jgi:hypothetical protein